MTRKPAEAVQMKKSKKGEKEEEEELVNEACIRTIEDPWINGIG
jgi:hypothetical protein